MLIILCTIVSIRIFSGLCSMTLLVIKAAFYHNVCGTLSDNIYNSHPFFKVTHMPHSCINTLITCFFLPVDCGLWVASGEARQPEEFILLEGDLRRKWFSQGWRNCRGASWWVLDTYNIQKRCTMSQCIILNNNYSYQLLTTVSLILTVCTHCTFPQLSAWSHRVWCTGTCRCFWPRHGRVWADGWLCCAHRHKSATRTHSGPAPLPQRSNWLLADEL